jgi:hypothetical protein
MGFDLITGFTELLQLVTNNYDAIANLHDLQSLHHTLHLPNVLCIHQSLPRNGSQQCPLSPLSTAPVLVRWRLKVTLRLTVNQSVSLGVEPHLGLMTKYLLLFCSYGLVFVRRPIWGEDGSVSRIRCWPLPVQSFLGPSPLGLATIFYCLIFETSLFVASYDSQDHGRGMRPHLHTGLADDWLTTLTL